MSRLLLVDWKWVAAARMEVKDARSSSRKCIVAKVEEGMEWRVRRVVMAVLNLVRVRQAR